MNIIKTSTGRKYVVNPAQIVRIALDEQDDSVTWANIIMTDGTTIIIDGAEFTAMTLDADTPAWLAR